MNKKKLAFVLSALSLSSLSLPAFATNLVKNGSFENSSISAVNGGIYYFPGILADWSIGEPAAGGVHHSVNSVGYLNAYQAHNVPIGDYYNSTASLPSNVTNSPDGGRFVSLDGSYEFFGGTIYQQLTGLTPNQPVTVTFDVAASTEQGVTGLLQTQGIAVDLSSSPLSPSNLGSNTSTAYYVPGSPTAKVYDVTGPNSNYGGTTPGQYLPSQDFSGWTKVTMTFTPTVSNPTLSFLAYGSDKGTLNSNPPLVLLDGVDVEAVPEPTNFLAVATVVGLFGASRLYKKSKASK